MGDAEAKPVPHEAEDVVSPDTSKEGQEDGKEKAGGFSDKIQSIKLGYASLLRKMSKKPMHVLLPKGVTTSTAPSLGRGSIYTEVPPLEDRFEERGFYPVNAPYSYIRISYDTEIAEKIYEILEPKIDEKLQDLVDLIKDTLERTVSYNWEDMRGKDKKEFLIASMESFLKSRSIHIDDISKSIVKYYVIREVFNKIFIIERPPICNYPYIP